jgi:fatty acid desaturase/cytochrome b involved in lipid metabolism
MCASDVPAVRRRNSGASRMSKGSMANLNEAPARDGLLKHSQERSEHWTLDGVQYDLRDFAARHPGGSHAIWTAKGLDVTALFLSYHPPEFAAKLRSYIVDSNAKKAPPLPQPDPLLADLRRRVSVAFGGVPVHHIKCPMWGWAVNLVLLCVYALLLHSWANSPTLTNASAFGAWGFICAGFLQHEGCHNALSRSYWVNSLGRWLLIPWADVAEWFEEHVILHHPFTNTAHDPNFQMQSGVVRHHPNDTWQPAHKWQILSILAYTPLVSILYSITGGTLMRALNLRSGVGLPSESRLYLLLAPLFFGLHYHAHGSVLLTLSPFFSFGVFFVWFTQLSHIQADCIGLDPLEALDHKKFVVQQMATTLDYSHGDWVATLTSIWLNYQTAHHLLPSVSHYNFADARFIKAFNEWKRDHNLERHWHYEQSFFRVLGSHLTWLYALGKPGCKGAPSPRHANAKAA